MPRGSRASGPARVPSAAAADRTIATVAGRPIGEAALEARLAELRRGPRARHIPPDGTAGSGDIRRWVLQELVTEAVVLHEARGAWRAAGDAVGSSPSPAAIERLVADVTDGLCVPDEELRSYYARNRDLYERSGAVVPFEEARPSIEAELLLAARRRAFDQWLDGRRRALVEIAPDYEHPGHPVHGVPSHRH